MPPRNTPAFDDFEDPRPYSSGRGRSYGVGRGGYSSRRGGGMGMGLDFDELADQGAEELASREIADMREQGLRSLQAQGLLRQKDPMAAGGTGGVSGVSGTRAKKVLTPAEAALKASKEEMAAAATQKARTTESAAYHKKNLKAFDEGPEGLELAQLQAGVSRDAKKAEERVGIIRGALTPGVSAGDVTEEAKAAQERLGLNSERLDALAQRRERLERQARDSEDMSAKAREEYHRLNDDRLGLTNEGLGRAAIRIDTDRLKMGLAPIANRPEVSPPRDEDYNPDDWVSRRVKKVNEERAALGRSDFIDPKTMAAYGGDKTKRRKDGGLELADETAIDRAVVQNGKSFGKGMGQNESEYARSLELGRLKASGYTHIGAQPIDKMIERYGGEDRIDSARIVEAAHRAKARLAEIDEALPGMTPKAREVLQQEQMVLKNVLAEKEDLAKERGLWDEVRDPFIFEWGKGGLLNSLKGAAPALVEAGESLARNAKYIPNLVLPGVTKLLPDGLKEQQAKADEKVAEFAQAMREEAEAWNWGIPENVRKQIDDNFITGDVARGVGSTAAFFGPSVIMGGIGKVAGLGEKALGRLLTTTVATTGAASSGNSGRRAAMEHLRPQLEAGEITREEFDKSVGLAELFHSGVGVSEAVPFSKFARRVGDLPAGRSFLSKMLEVAGKSGGKTASTWLKGQGRKMLVDVVSEGLEEAGQEWVQAVAGDLINQKTFNPDQEIDWAGAAKNAAVGGLTGLMFSGVTNALQAPKVAERYRELGDAVKRGAKKKTDGGGDAPGSGVTPGSGAPPPSSPSGGKVMPDADDPFTSKGPAGDIEADEELAAELGVKKPAPAEFIGVQEMPGGPGFDLYNLTADIPGHPKGSSVSRETLEKAGFTVPPRPAAQQAEQPISQPSAAASDQSRAPASTPAPGPAAGTKPKFDKSSTQVTLPEAEAKPFRQFAQSIPEADVYTEDGDYGRENEPHITALYGINNDDVEPVRQALAGIGPVTVTLGETSAFENEDKPYDVLKVGVDSPALKAVNAAIKKATDNSSDFPDYKPHLTLAYVKKGAAKKYVGDRAFAGKTITFDSLQFRTRDGRSIDIPLGGQTGQNLASQTPASTPATEPVPAGQIPAVNPPEAVGSEEREYRIPTPSQGPDGGAGSAPNTGSGRETAPVPASAPAAEKAAPAVKTTPAAFVSRISSAAKVRPASKQQKFLADFARRLSKASPDAFASLQIKVVPAKEWAESVREAPDSRAAFQPGTNTLFLNADRVDASNIVELVVHEAGHFAERFYLGEEFTQAEWEKLSHEQRLAALKQYDPKAEAGSVADLMQNRRARAEWVAMQFARVVTGRTAGMSEKLKAGLEKFLKDVREMVKKWIGNESLTTAALDAKILEMLGYAEQAQVESTAAPTKQKPATGERQMPVSPPKEVAPRGKTDSAGRNATESKQETAPKGEAEIASSRAKIAAQTKLIRDLTAGAKKLAERNPAKAKPVFDRIAQEQEKLTQMLAAKRSGTAPRVGTLPNGEPDLLTDIAEHVGLLQTQPKEGRAVGGELDSAVETLGQGAARLLRGGKEGTAWDEAVEIINTETGRNFQSVGDFQQAITNAVAQRRQLGEAFKTEEYKQGVEAAALTNEGRGAATKPKAGVPIEKIGVGGKFEIRGEKFSVVDIDEGPGGQVLYVIKDGHKFMVPEGTMFFADRGTLKKGKPERVATYEDPLAADTLGAPRTPKDRTRDMFDEGLADEQFTLNGGTAEDASGVVDLEEARREAKKAADEAQGNLFGAPVDRDAILSADEINDPEAAQATARTLRQAARVASGGSGAVSANQSGRLPSLREQEEALKEWAGAAGLMIEPTTFAAEWRKQGSQGGAENQVYFDEASQRYVKRNALLFNDDWVSFFRRIMAHNRLFPDTAYLFHGFTPMDDTQPDIASKKVTIQAVLSQPVVRGEGATIDEIGEALVARGFEENGLSGQFEDERFILDDLGGNNVLKDEAGNIRFIDPQVSAKPGIVLGSPAEPQTESAAFRRWFGDSKVVDADGKPLVVYHGTGSDFTEFKPGIEGYYGQGGIYFSSKPGAAEIFADQAISGGNIRPVYLSLRNPYRDDGSKNVTIDQLKKRGHDGIISDSGMEEGDVMYVAFAPTQIKSAIGNRGAFDPNDPSILGAPADLTPPKNAEVPGQPGYRYRSHPDTLIERGLDAIRQVYKTQDNATTAKAAKAFVDNLKDDAAAVAAANDDTNTMPGAVRTAVKLLVEQKLVAIWTDEKADPKERAAARRKWDRLVEAVAERGTDLGQEIQAFDMANRITPDGVLLAAGKAIKARQEKIIGEDGKKAIDEASKILNAENEKAIDEATKEMDRALRAVKVSKDIWKQYREVAAQHWLRRIDAALNGAPTPPPLMEFTNALIREVQNRIDATLPPGEPRPQRAPVDIIRDAVNNRAANKDAWDAVRKALGEKYASQPEVLEQLDEAMMGLLDKPYSDQTLDRAIKEAHKEMGVKVQELARQYYKQADLTGQSLADHLVEKAGLKGEDAERLANLVKLRVANLTAETKKAALMRMLEPRAGKAKALVGLADKLIEMSNLGAFSKDEYFTAVAKELDLPGLSDKQAAKLRELAEKAQNTPEGFQRDRVLTDLLTELQKVKGIGAVDVATAVYYAHILSGYTTQMVNAVSTAMNTAADVAVMIARRPTTTLQAIRGIRDGARTGFVQALSILDTGYAHRSFDEKMPEVAPILEALAKDTDRNAALRAYAKALRYVSRGMKAMDAVFFQSAAEAYQRVAAARLAAEFEGGKLNWQQRSQKVRDLLAMSPAEFEAARVQAKAEGLTGLDYQLRVGEILRQKRDASLVERGVAFGREATFNQAPRGYLGVAAKAIRDASNKFPPLRLFVPFTNVVANVANASLNYSPVGAVRAFRGYGGEGAPSTTEERDALLMKGIAGSMGLIFLLAYGMGDDDEETPWITGTGPQDTAARNQLRKTGWKPNTVKIGNAYVSYLETPLAIPLAIVGNYIDGVKYNGLDHKAAGERLAKAIATVPETIVSMSFLRGLADFMDAARGRKSWGDIASGVVASATVPNLVRQIDRTFDPKLYEANGLAGGLAGQIPGVRQTFPERIDVVGQPIQSAPIERFGRAATGDELWDTLAAKQAWIPEAGKTTKLGGQVLTPAQYRAYVQLSGPGIETRLRAALPRLKLMTKEQADDFVERVTREERARVKPQLRAIKFEVD